MKRAWYSICHDTWHLTPSSANIFARHPINNQYFTEADIRNCSFIRMRMRTHSNSAVVKSKKFVLAISFLSSSLTSWSLDVKQPPQVCHQTILLRLRFLVDSAPLLLHITRYILILAAKSSKPMRPPLNDGGPSPAGSTRSACILVNIEKVDVCKCDCYQHERVTM